MVNIKFVNGEPHKNGQNKYEIIIKEMVKNSIFVKFFFKNFFSSKLLINKKNKNNPNIINPITLTFVAIAEKNEK